MFAGEGGEDNRGKVRDVLMVAVCFATLAFAWDFRGGGQSGCFQLPRQNQPSSGGVHS